MGYPRRANWLLYRHNADGSCRVHDCRTGENYTLGSAAAALLLRLDGKTDPFRALPGWSNADIQEMLDALSRAELIRWSRMERSGKTSFAYSLIIPRRCSTRNPLLRWCNRLLLMLLVSIEELTACLLARLLWRRQYKALLIRFD